MEWTEPKSPIEGISYYHHVTCETPLGQAIIEWKGWKLNDSYSVTIGNEYVGEGLCLDESKQIAKEYITKKYIELSNLLNFKS